MSFRKTHDLRELLTLLDSSGYPISEELWKADDLTDYAMQARYPGLSEPVSGKEYRVAVALAETVVRWAQKEITDKKRRKRKS